MSLPYVLRLLFLCLATFFVINAVAGLLVSISSRGVVHLAKKMQPHSGTRFLLYLRLLPLVLGATAVFGLCVPSYLWLEPQGAPERVGLTCLTLALLATANWLLSIMRVSRAIASSLRCTRIWQQAGRETFLTGDSSAALVVKQDAPVLALAGVFRPRMVISDGVLRSLSSRQLEVALQHENAHRASRDNFKRVLLLLAPEPLPFVHWFSFLEKAWAKVAEWAADDAAARGDSLRALSLASALLRVARMGASPRLSLLHTSLVADNQDLATRIDRLSRTQPTRQKTLSWTPIPVTAALLAAGSFATLLLLWPGSLSSVHRLLEQFLR